MRRPSREERHGYEPSGKPFPNAGRRLGDTESMSGAAYGAAASLVSTAADLDRFFCALFTGRVIPRSLVALMQAMRPVTPGLDYERYGLGLEGSRYPCGLALGHGWNVWGYRAVVRPSRTASHLIVLLINYDYDDLITPIDRTVSWLFCQP